MHIPESKPRGCSSGPSSWVGSGSHSSAALGQTQMVDLQRQKAGQGLQGSGQHKSFGNPGHSLPLGPKSLLLDPECT